MAKPNFSKLIVPFAIVFLLFLILSPIIFYYYTSFEKDIVVKEKYTFQTYNRYSSKPYYYVVSTDDVTYEIVNMWWKFDFNKINDYGKLDVGKTYRVKGYGIPFLGILYNIYDIGV